ncbi:hypothetical protein AAHA92_32967 [Salvia divinorum]|uniref:Uncharacterized protein n=1 Tax=Salvia divinorum TaxID=28513 RepID=A0ABD1FQI8_SALDI
MEFTHHPPFPYYQPNLTPPRSKSRRSQPICRNWSGRAAISGGVVPSQTLSRLTNHRFFPLSVPFALIVARVRLPSPPLIAAWRLSHCPISCRQCCSSGRRLFCPIRSGTVFTDLSSLSF